MSSQIRRHAGRLARLLYMAGFRRILGRGCCELSCPIWADFVAKKFKYADGAAKIVEAVKVLRAAVAEAATRRSRPEEVRAECGADG
jgi:hypothetical protein